MLYYLLAIPAILVTIWIFFLSPALSLWWIIPVAFGCFVAANLLYALFMLILSLLVDTRKENKTIDRFYLRATLLFDDWILTICRAKIHLVGAEKLPPEGEFLLVCNHRSNFDPLVTWWALRDRPLAFVSKPENMYKIVFARCTHKCCFLAIDRENPRNALKTINTVAELMRNHECSFAIYPEGTRSKSGQLLEFRNGALKAAKKANVPIAVATIEGTEQIARRTPWRATDVYLTILDVVDAATVKATSTHDLGESIHAQMYAQLGQ